MPKVSILPFYCINGDKIYLHHIYPSIKEDGLLLKFSKNSDSIKLNSSQIVDILDQRGYKVEDKSGGVINFKKDCQNHLENVKDKLQQAFQSTYPSIFIQELKIKPRNSLPSDFSLYRFKNISISKSQLKKTKGTFIAHYETTNAHIKNIYINFEIKASISVFIASRNISKNQVLNASNCLKESISLEKLPYRPLQTFKQNTFVAKFNIKQGSILSTHQFRTKLLLSRGSIVEAFIKDGALSLQVEAKALEGGDKGDLIRIKTRDGKVFRAVVQAHDKVLIK